MKLLVLGGTADARHVVMAAYEQGIFNKADQVVYSIAGLVRKPELPCDLRVGGFTQEGGLEAYCLREGIAAIFDITHPYAAQMSAKASDVAQGLNIPLWRFHRPEWRKQEADDWRFAESMSDLITALPKDAKVLFTSGQLEANDIDFLKARDDLAVIVRTAAPHRETLPENWSWIKGIGPFELSEEKALLGDLGVTALVTKNSGGASTEAKLHAARELSIPVFLLQRPSLPEATQLIASIEEALVLLRSSFSKSVK